MLAELFGTFGYPRWLRQRRDGSHVPHVGLVIGVSLAFGSRADHAYAIGHISGCHLIQPIHWLVAQRFPVRAAGYVAAQFAAESRGRSAVRHREWAPGFSVTAGFAANGFGEHSPGGIVLPHS